MSTMRLRLINVEFTFKIYKTNGYLKLLFAFQMSLLITTVIDGKFMDFYALVTFLPLDNIFDVLQREFYEMTRLILLPIHSIRPSLREG
ncbi:CLUMA_CG000803, isoform A [Clunio marinus]|uniref:CLUMA_CG000803, isoform A n=1 Tax=Clunio marinus TaxID=568069 RepID=A0A1J1HKK0_9DIPT|nr:CLUMA_CG000803, isoform A [Clunio marinus]